MKKILILLVVAIVAAFASPAAAQTVFPTKTGALISFRAQAPAPALDANGDPLTPPAAAISLHFVGAPTVQILGSCTVPDATGIAHFVDLPIADDGTRRVMRGRSHELAGCSGMESVQSPNVAIVFFNATGEPTLLAPEAPAAAVPDAHEIIAGTLKMEFEEDEDLPPFRDGGA